MNKNFIVLFILISVIGFFAYQNARYILGDNDQVVITQFGKVVGDARVPGEHFKIPFIQKVHFFKKNLFLCERSQEIPSKDKKFISFNNKAFWKITDPTMFYKKLNSYNLANNFVFDHTGEAERRVVTSHVLKELLGDATKRGNLENVDCNPDIENQIFRIAKESMAAAGAGIALNNIEAKIILPINAEKP